MENKKILLRKSVSKFLVYMTKILNFKSNNVYNILVHRIMILFGLNRFIYTFENNFVDVEKDEKIKMTFLISVRVNLNESNCPCLCGTIFTNCE